MVLHPTFSFSPTNALILPCHVFVFQRGSDELLSQNGGVSNGGSISPQGNHSDNNNDAKKVRKLLRYLV